MTDTAADITSAAGEPDPLDAPPPAFTPRDAERMAADVFGVDAASRRRSSASATRTSRS